MPKTILSGIAAGAAALTLAASGAAATITSCVGDGWPHCCWSISTDWFAAPVEIVPESSVDVP